MNINIDKCKVLYLEKEKFLYTIFLSVLLYLLVLGAFKDTPYLVICALSIIYLIGACTVVMLTRSIFSIHKKNYYKYISCMYTCISMFSMFKVIPTDLINNKFLIALRNDAFLNTTYMHILSIGFYGIIQYVDGYIDDDAYRKKVKNRAINLFIVSNISFFLNYIFLLLGYSEILIITNILTLVILTTIIRRFQGMKVVQGNKVNAVMLLIYIISTIALLNVLTCLTPFGHDYVRSLDGIIIFTAYICLLVSIVDKMVNRPYKMLFADLYRENLEMDILNGRVVKKNRDLEFSQAIIKKKEKMFKTFFINVPIPLVMTSKKGRIIFANSSFQKLIEEENIKNIINKKIYKLIQLNDINSLDDLREHDNTAINGIINCTHNRKYVDIDFVKISENYNELLFILNDVTTRVKIGRLKTEMENNKFQEKIKSDFLSNISHDLKTPINVIYSAAQLITMFIKKNDKDSLSKYNTICKLNCLSLIRLTNNLIDSSKIYSDFLSPNIQVKNIVEIVEEVCMSLIYYAESKDINLIFDTNEEEVYIKIDEEFIQRIIINLISNAIKFTEEKGKIEVIIHNEEKQVVINVRDNGVGMDTKFVEEAFKRYSMGSNNSKSREKGTGIGLFVVKKLVEKQNGKINIKSEKNKGTDVEMKFYKEI